jgi:hypothetical protein
MAAELIRSPINATLQGVGQALERAIPLACDDAEERAERHELRRIEIGEALRR